MKTIVLIIDYFSEAFPDWSRNCRIFNYTFKLSNPAFN